MVKYHKLFEVKFFHKYYEAFSSKDFIIYPTQNTIAYFQSFGIIFKQTNEGFILLYKEEKQALLEKLNEVITFEFGIGIKNKYFETFTNILPSSESHKYVFSNSNLLEEESNNKSLKGNQIKIHPDGFVNKKNVCLCCYNHTVLRELLGKSEVLVQQEDEKIFEGKLEDWHNVGKILGNNFGMYNITPVDSEQMALLYLPDSLSKSFGIIELSIGGNDISFSEISGTEYQVWLDSRHVQWNYYFISETKKQYDAVDVFSGKEKLSFTDPESVMLINGQQALKVMSKQFFALKYRYNEQNIFAEIKSNVQNTHGDLRDKKVNLITPDVSRIKGKRENGSEIYFSDMYIYF